MLNVRQFECRAVKRTTTIYIRTLNDIKLNFHNALILRQREMRNFRIFHWKNKINSNFSSLGYCVDDIHSKVFLQLHSSDFCGERDANEKPIIVDHKMKYLLKFPHWTWPRFEGESSSSKFSNTKMEFSALRSLATSFKRVQLFTWEILQIKILLGFEVQRNN